MTILNNIDTSIQQKERSTRTMSFEDQQGMRSRIHDTVSSFALSRGSRLGNSNHWEISPSPLPDVVYIEYIDKVASDR